MKNANNYSKDHVLYLKKRRNKSILINFARVGILAVLLLIWELFAQFNVIDPFITSSPSRIMRTIGDLYSNGSLFYHIGITLAETLVGFIIAVALGYAIAVALYLSDSVRKIFEPYIVVLNALPKIALGPLIIIWIGTGYSSIIFMTVLVAIIVCIMNTLTGFLSVDKTMLTLMKAMGANKRTILVKLIIPASFPSLINTLKVAVGLAWIGSIMGEYIASRAGLGYLIVYGGQVFKLDLVMTATIILCALAGGMYGVIALIEKSVNK
ncbi:MAG: ABC transporter permease [Clostridia bacterium]|nr:ABC transporter permease [Clostridia bacterium]